MISSHCVLKKPLFLTSNTLKSIANALHSIAVVEGRQQLGMSRIQLKVVRLSSSSLCDEVLNDLLNYPKTSPPTSSVQPKPGLGIGNRNQGPILVSVLKPIFFSETETFFSETETFFSNFFNLSNFSYVFTFLGDISFVSLKINLKLQK